MYGSAIWYFANVFLCDVLVYVGAFARYETFDLIRWFTLLRFDWLVEVGCLHLIV